MQSGSKTFTIAEYVLPKYEVTVTAPIDSTFSDTSLRINVQAVYTYGENVKGVAVVSVSAPNYSWQTTPSPIIVQKQVNINGNVYIDFNLISELKTNSTTDYQTDFLITASVTEDLTGLTNFIEISR